MGLEASIAEEVRVRGALSFARYMELALYDRDGGYYATGLGGAGWEGHFLTSPVLDPAFGELWAEGFRRVWTACGSPSDFEVVEIGPGDGSFAASVLDHVHRDLAAGLTYRLVDLSPHLRRSQHTNVGDRAGIVWHRALEEVPRIAAGCVFANEVLDNLPVELVRSTGERLEQAFVDDSGDGLMIAWREAGPDVAAFFSTEVPSGTCAEVGLEAIRLTRLAARLVGRGAVVFVDYGDEEADLLRRPNGTLLCYSRAGVDDRPLERPGQKDITSHANWTAIRRALAAEGLKVAATTSQRDALVALGLDTLHDRLRAETGSGRGFETVRAVSRRQALGILTDAEGLGGFDVVVGARGFDPESLLTTR
jgi:SAM-dependent MidA family methyltransferase